MARSNLVNAVDVALATDVAGADPTIQVTDPDLLPAVPFYLVIDPFGDSSREYLRATSLAVDVLSVERNLDGSQSTTHTAGDIVRISYVAQNLSDIWDAIEAIPDGDGLYLRLDAANDPVVCPDVLIHAVGVFPGTVGNYIDTPNINLLDADFAHLVQSQPWEWTGGTLVSLGIQPDGFGLMQFTLGDVTNPRIQSGVVDWPMPSGNIVVSGEFTNPQSTDRSVRLRLVDNGSSPFATDQLIPAGATVRISYAFTGIVSPVTQVWMQCSSTPSVGDPWVEGDLLNVSKLTIAEGSDPAFVPSLRIVGDLDLRVKAAADDWASPTTQTFLDNYSPGGYRLNLAATRIISVTATGVSSIISENTAAYTLTNGAATTIRMTMDTSSGGIVWYQDGTQVSTDSFSAQALSPSSIGLYVGATDSNSALFDGKLYWIEVRDGIDGPIVARYDPNEHAAAQDAGETTWVGADGRPWEVFGDVIAHAESISPAATVDDIATHAAITDAHHTRYTDAEAITAVGPHTPPFSALHADLTDVTADQHHTRYTDAEAVAAVGTPWEGVYLPLSGGTLTGMVIFEFGHRLQFNNAGSGSASLAIDPNDEGSMRIRLGGSSPGVTKFDIQVSGDSSVFEVGDHGVIAKRVFSVVGLFSTSDDVTIGTRNEFGANLASMSVRNIYLMDDQPTGTILKGDIWMST